MKYAVKLVLGLADVGDQMPGGLEKFQTTNFSMPNNCYLKCTLKSIPGLADVGDSHGVGDGPRAPPRCQGCCKKFRMINLSMPNNSCYMKYSLKSVPGLADVGDPHGGKDCSRTPARGSRSKKHPHHADQHEKLKG